MIAVALLAAALPAQEQPRGAALIVVPQKADYPPEVVAAKAAGTILLSLHIDPDGKLRCIANSNTGPAVLRRPSCLLVARRWPFGPNVDAKGVPQPTDLPIWVRWELEPPATVARNDYDGATPISPGSWMTDWDYPMAALEGNNGGEVYIAFDIGTAGKITSCRIVEAAKSHSINAAVCPNITRRAIFLPAVGADGLPRMAKGHLMVRFVLLGSPKPSKPSAAH